MERTAYWTAADDQPVSREDAEKAWKVEAHRVLSRVAGTYRGVIESGELANELQETTGIHTRSQVRTWLGAVLVTLAREGHEVGEPPLASLVVQKSTGMVGARYDEILKVTGGTPPRPTTSARSWPPTLVWSATAGPTRTCRTTVAAPP